MALILLIDAMLVSSIRFARQEMASLGVSPYLLFLNSEFQTIKTNYF